MRLLVEETTLRNFTGMFLVGNFKGNFFVRFYLALSQNLVLTIEKNLVIISTL